MRPFQDRNDMLQLIHFSIDDYYSTKFETTGFNCIRTSRINRYLRRDLVQRERKTARKEVMHHIHHESIMTRHKFVTSIFKALISYRGKLSAANFLPAVINLSLLLPSSTICNHDFLHEECHNPAAGSAAVIVGSIDDGRHIPWVRRAIEQVHKQHHAVTHLWMGQQWGRQEENAQGSPAQRRQEEDGGKEGSTLCVHDWKASTRLGNRRESLYEQQEAELVGQSL
jgi:hypothetical protein